MRVHGVFVTGFASRLFLSEFDDSMYFLFFKVYCGAICCVGEVRFMLFFMFDGWVYNMWCMFCGACCAFCVLLVCAVV